MSVTSRNRNLQHRPITTAERDLIQWLLEHGKSGSERFLPQLHSLIVVSKCTCGCPTINFAQDGDRVAEKAEQILADYIGSAGDESVGILLFQEEGRLSSLEVYSLSGSDQPFGLPSISTLTPA